MAKRLSWLAGSLLGTIVFSPPVLNLINDVNLILGGSSYITHQGESTLLILLVAWIILGFLWWIFLQGLGDLKHFIAPFLLSWSSAIFFFSLLRYEFALVVWLLFSLIIWLC
jgi:hypothetical protein